MALLIALVLDAWLGEPRWLWARVPHPAVLMGRGVEALDRRLNRGGARRAKGAAALALLGFVAWTVGAMIEAIPLGVVPEALGAAVLLAQRSLADHVRAVAVGLRASIEGGRAAVAQIVGRDTEAMDEPAVARAAIESAAENLSDGVVAPALAFAVAGLPGMALYKVVNTADSMIGHRTERHEAFGWASARADDLLNWVPARLTALLIAAIGGRVDAWREIGADARLHRSPNAGWPEAAAARALDVALSGPRRYEGRLADEPFVNPDGRHEVGADDVDAAVRLIWRAWVGLSVGAALVAIV